MRFPTGRASLQAPHHAALFFVPVLITLFPVFDLTTGAVVYCCGLAAFFLGLWIYYDRRDHARFEAERRKTTFHCIRCDHLYSKRGRHESAPCPRCGFENGRLRF